MDTLGLSDFGDDRKVFDRALCGDGRKASGSPPAARCSPILGTDYIQDDNSWLTPKF